MKGDFTRDTFDPGKHFLRVLMQQGRVQVDADWNEQIAILLHYMQTLAADLIGPHGGPAADWGFEIKGLSNTRQVIDFTIGKGRYYVDGILCENGEGNVTYKTQSDYPKPPELETKGNEQNYLVYLDVWERHISHLEDELIREVALGGADTATRAKVVWQVKVTNKIPQGKDGGEENIPPSVPAQEGWCQWVNINWSKWLEQWQPKNRGHLKAKGKEDPHEDTDPCIVSPESRFRRAENRLYRVEIHSGGKLGNATFKWARDNGSVVLVVKKIEHGAQPNTTKVTLTSLGSGCEISLAVGDLVEIVDDDSVLMNEAKPLLEVIAIDQIDRTVTLKGVREDIDKSKHPLLRRWDFKTVKQKNVPIPDDDKVPDDDKALPIKEGEWLTLENGVQIWFETGTTDSLRIYRTGDYWLIPARVETGDVEWPKELGGTTPKALPSRGVLHHYAPLAILSVDPPGNTTVEQLKDDCRCEFDPISRRRSLGEGK